MGVERWIWRYLVDRAMMRILFAGIWLLAALAIPLHTDADLIQMPITSSTPSSFTNFASTYGNYANQTTSTSYASTYGSYGND